MKQTFFSAGVAIGILTLCLAAPAMAQNEPPGLAVIRACTFVNGSGANDLRLRIEEQSRWLDERKLDMQISTLMPVFTSEEITFDVALYYRFADASAMGRVYGEWLGPEGAAFMRNVLDCSSGTEFAFQGLRPPPAGRNGGPIQLFNCTLKDGQNGTAARAALTNWADATRRFETAHAMLNPIAGESQEATYNFKWLLAFRSWQDYGDSLGALFSGGPSQAQIIGPVMNCDRARIYHQTIYRRLQAG